MALLELSLLLIAAVYLFYKWATSNFHIFELRGVPYEKPLPVIGNSLPLILNKESMMLLLMKFYRRTKQHKIFGFFIFRKPIFIINDPETIKKIAIKDFEFFPNHMQFFQSNDKLFNGFILMMKDQRWKDMRNTLTPIFTASKMRSMFTLMNECFDENVDYIRGLAKENNGEAELEMKQCFTRLSNDIIATTAFGLSVHSYKDINNEFYSIGQSVTALKAAVMVKFMLMQIAPKLMSIFGVSLFNKKQTEYFMRLVIDTMKYREENKVVRPDMIQLIMEAKKESNQQWTDEELVAQCFIFFFAAFENNANVICTTCYELMMNPDVQQRLYEEVSEMQEQLKGAKLSYDDLHKMKYLDMVLSESLRKWTLTAAIDRACSKDYTLRDDDDNVIFEFKAGDNIWFPVAGLHWDENYFENPEVFDPERFSDDNKQRIVPNTYLPFGIGPRNCIGNRYALMQAKAMIYYLLRDFKLERSPKSVENLLEDIRTFQISPKSGFWIKFVQRK